MLQAIIGKKRVKVAERCIFRTNIFSRGTGLMLHKKISDEAHIFVMKKPQKVSITMFFMLFSIDILFLNEKKEIVELYKSLKPWTNLFPKKKSQYVIEVSEGTIKKKGLKEGIRLSF